MKTNAIRDLVIHKTLHELEILRLGLIGAEAGHEAIPGADRAEKLTHVLAAIWVKQQIENQGISLADSVRRFGARVRNTIS